MLDSIPTQPINTGLRDLVEFGPRCELIDKKDLAAAARAKVGASVDFSFTRFVDWLRSEGYEFSGFDNVPLRILNERDNADEAKSLARERPTRHAGDRLKRVFFKNALYEVVAEREQ